MEEEERKMSISIMVLGRFIGKFFPENRRFVSSKRFFTRHLFRKIYPHHLGISWSALMELHRRGCKEMRFIIIRDDVEPSFEEVWVTDVETFLAVDESGQPKFSKIYMDKNDAQRLLPRAFFKIHSGGEVIQSSIKELKEQKSLKIGEFARMKAKQSFTMNRRTKGSMKESDSSRLDKQTKEGLHKSKRKNFQRISRNKKDNLKQEKLGCKNERNY